MLLCQTDADDPGGAHALPGGPHAQVPPGEALQPIRGEIRCHVTAADQ